MTVKVAYFLGPPCTSGFSLRVYQVNFCKSEKPILPLQTLMAMKGARNVDVTKTQKFRLARSTGHSGDGHFK